ncbi:hypothetical protein [Legionella genomosp. 1]|uniref:hypothetical protein n=1 Tax=Legionella genomosp. 1 TaxID=1093625 RepID=UPI0010552A1A|nr:hypothetical protein [Legionella genomosp. 1]
MVTKKKTIRIATRQSKLALAQADIIKQRLLGRFITLMQVYESLAERTKALVNGLIERAQARNIPLIADYEGGMFGFFFTEEPEVRNFKQVQKSNESRFKTFYHGMLESGVYLAPSMYEAGFVSCCHGEEEIAKTLNAADEVFRTL